ncbi:hypothetical protein FNJ88_11760 [Chryseobacterium sp. SNU WT5]|uniref:hypothetical protein n=1 Tax=Chryseobacterium sp. SNU WT5 TaxID=2594269 RepID=UPI00117F7988|nr:hypothetical protein [Chryseobacterium sp. SNU WT5]QDP86189.1 hypothetical protein FNJ88_11760 [Chryseobacterium sp. SNU WT5]
MKIEETALDHIRSLPRFKIYTDISREEYTEYLRGFLNERTHEYTGNVNNEAAIIRVKTENDHYWKPCLSLRTEIDTEENKTLIRGIFGPTSAVWTFFMFLNFIFGIMWMVTITLWYVEKQIKSNDFSWALPFSFVMLFLLLLTFLAARVGKYLAREEMAKLRKFAEQSIANLESW